MDRAYSLLTVKSVSEDKRIIRGIATTPAPDRVGDIVEPLGVTFKNPMPLLWQHKHDKPVGTVRFKVPTADGVEFEAELPTIKDAGALKDRVDEAWQSVTSGLVSGVSIGFRALEYSFLDEGGMRFTKSEVFELSLVTIPANAEATIQLVKSLDQERAASGTPAPASKSTPSAEGKSLKPISLKPKEGNDMATLAEQIAALEAARAQKSAKMESVMQKSMDENRSTDAQEQEEFDTLAAEVKSIDADLERLRTLERVKAAAAKPVVGGNAAAGSASRDATVPAQVKMQQKLDPGIAFARIARVKALAKLDGESVREVAKALYGEDSSVYGFFAKAAVPAATTGHATWAGPLVGDETSAFADFVEYLRPQTILGKFGSNGVPSLRRVPFRVPLIGQTSGGAGYWVGEGAAKPLTKFDFSRTTLDPLKVANIAVATMETLRDSSPSAEGIIRDQLAAALTARLDTDFIDPAKAAAAGVSPASITNGLTFIASSGTDADAVRADIKAIFAAFIAANNAPTSGVWIMPATTALALSLMQNPLGQSEFPGISMNGGTLFGLPVIVSQYVPTNYDPDGAGTDYVAGALVALVNASDIYLADDGGVSVDMSQEASLQMDDAPTNNSGTPTATQLVSMFQTNSVAFRAERTINWAKRRPSAIAALAGVNWG
ncbi:phage major capsid protein [Paracoccus sp. NGMCC 1.201697]|uniref:Phage major capsid protein n=1 Tax=Paracoccus broussonetiae subsp. drimophilus TaxID=3373869 RepID=A0ABW7LGY0_9RHOB